MPITENYPILKTALLFSLVGGLANATIYTFFALLVDIFIHPLTANMPLWITLITFFFSVILFGVVFSLVNGIILALLKFRINHKLKYFSLFLLGFFLTLPITFILMVGFGANKTNAEIGLAVLMFGLSGGFGNVIAGKVTLPKT